MPQDNPPLLDKTMNTTEQTPRNLADVLASGLASIANNVKPDGSDISISVPGMSANNVDDGFSELKQSLGYKADTDWTRVTDCNLNIQSLFNSGIHVITSLVSNSASNRPIISGVDTSGYITTYIWDWYTYATQLYVCQANRRIFTRFYNNGTWSAWAEFAPQSLYKVTVNGTTDGSGQITVSNPSGGYCYLLRNVSNKNTGIGGDFFVYNLDSVTASNLYLRVRLLSNGNVVANTTIDETLIIVAL